MTHNTPRTLLLLAAFVASSVALVAVSKTNGLPAQINTITDGFSDGSDKDGEDDSAYCGNYTIDEGEECDDGPDGGISCTSNCRFPFSSIGGDGDNIGSGTGGSSAAYRYCGDGVVNMDAEECDDGNTNADDECTPDCKLARCGDGILQERMGEECDEGDANGFDDCSLECKKKDGSNTPVCGDGIAEGDEQCDDGNGDNRDYCLNTCKLSFCGDRVVQAVRGEKCDDGNKEDNDKCTNKCQLAICGDGMVQTALGEECDEGQKNGGLGVHCSSLCKKRVIESNDDDNEVEQVSSSSSSKVSSATSSEVDDEDEQEQLLREQREALQKQLEENIRRAKEAEEARQEAEEAQSETDEKEESVETLVCFNAAGELISDRAECAPNQGEFIVEQKTQDISDEQAREALRRKLLGENVEQLRQQNLLLTLQSARVRLQALLDRGEYRPEVENYFTEGIKWIDRGIEYFSSPRSLSEVQQMVPPVKQLLAQAQGLVQQERHIADIQTTRDITPILKKTERLLMKFRESFIALAQGGVALDQGALEKYTEAAELFNEIANTCVQSGQRCFDVNEVLELLKVAQGPLQDALGVHPEIYQKVQEKFAE